MTTTFRKVLSANDAGETKSHQAGMLIPKGDAEFREFLGFLDAGVKNPRRTIKCIDEDDQPIELQYIYYNNKFHDERGTRNEYRLTHLTGYLKRRGAKAGDEIELSRADDHSTFRIRLVVNSQSNEMSSTLSNRVVLRGWRRVH